MLAQSPRKIFLDGNVDGQVCSEKSCRKLRKHTIAADALCGPLGTLSWTRSQFRLLPEDNKQAHNIIKSDTKRMFGEANYISYFDCR